MCNPAGMLVGGLGMGVAQTAFGMQAANTEAAYANASAAYGYAGAMDEYNAQMTAINRQEAWKWHDYQMAVNDRQAAMDYQWEQYGKTRDSVRGDFAGKFDAIRAGMSQFQEATINQLEHLWTNFKKSNATHEVERLNRGVEGRSSDDVAQDALRAMVLNESAAITNMQWNINQSASEAAGYAAQAESTINAAFPPPMAQVSLPTPRQQLNAPSWFPYGMQQSAASAQWYNNTTNSIMGGIGTGLSAGGQYYQYTTPPSEYGTY